MENNIQEEFICAICLEMFEEPVTIICGHNFCYSCIAGQIKNSKIVCPICQEEIFLPKGSASLKKNITLHNIVQNEKKKYIKNNNYGSGVDDEIRKLIVSTFCIQDETIEIQQIQQINNNYLKQRFQNQQKLLQQKKQNSQILIKLHGTNKANAQKIAAQGFQLPTSYQRSDGKEGGLTFGLAIYLTSFSIKAHEYTEGTNCFIVCQIILGRVKQLQDQDEDYHKLYPEKALQMNIDTIYCSHSKNYIDIQKGCEVDEYAIYNPSFILPTHIVYYTTSKVNQCNEFTQYTGEKTYDITKLNFSLLIKLFKNGTLNQQYICCRIIGDLCRDQQSKTVQQIFKERVMFFEAILSQLTKTNEQLVIRTLRILWNSAYNNKLMAENIIDNINVQILFQFLKNKSYSIVERASGVMKNLTQLSQINCEIIFQFNSFKEVFQIINKFSKDDQKQQGLVNLLGFVANVSNHIKIFTKYQQEILAINELLFENNNQDVKEEVLRILSNQIGYTQEWLINGYVPQKGIQSI